MTIENVIKKDGRIEKFDPEKIRHGLFKSVQAAGGSNKEKSDQIANKITQQLEEKFSGTIKSSDILDIVEMVLLKGGHDKVSRAFILHRYRNEMLRKSEDTDKDNILIKHFLDKSDWTIKENANTNYSLSAMNFNMAQKITQNFWLSEIYTPEIAKAHIDGDFHIHDLGIFGAYCCGLDLLDLLQTGFGGVTGTIWCKPPKHFRTALGQMVNYMYSLQNEIAGAIAFSNFDTLLAPYVRYDKLERKDVKQCIQEFIFNMNVPTRSAMQTPFSNLSFDLECPVKMKKDDVYIGGKSTGDKYGDFQREMDLINDVFCEVLLEGDGNGRVFTFPIPTYNITNQFEWDNPKLDNLWKLTAKYGSPTFVNYLNSSMSPDDSRSFCCRLKSSLVKIKYRGNGLFGSYPLVGSLGVCSINMPRLGYLYKDEKIFFEELEKLLNLAKESLILKRKTIEKYTEEGLYPFIKQTLRNIKLKTGEYWANHFSTLGLLGMDECLLNMGKPDISTPEGVAFSEKVLDFFLKKCEEYEKETGVYFNIEAAPGEGTTRRFANLDKKKYPNILVANEENYKKNKMAPYYSNSTQLKVGANIDLFTALKLQEPLQIKYTGGTIFHIFLGESSPSPESIKNLIKKCCENYKIPYYAISPTFSICGAHGYLKGRHKYCPLCLEPNEVIPDEA